jgi:hypothetical protein
MLKKRKLRHREPQYVKGAYPGREKYETPIMLSSRCPTIQSSSPAPVCAQEVDGLHQCLPWSLASGRHGRGTERGKKEVSAFVSLASFLQAPPSQVTAPVGPPSRCTTFSGFWCWFPHLLLQCWALNHPLLASYILPAPLEVPLLTFPQLPLI